MKTTRLLSLLFLVIIFLSSCQEESFENSPVVLDELELAESFLLRSPTLVPFVAINLNHETFRIDGFMIDKTSKVRAIEMNNATFFNLDLADLSEQFMKSLYDESEVISDISAIELVANLKKIGAVATTTMDGIIDEESLNSKIYFTFKVNTEVHEAENCGGPDNRVSPVRNPSFSKVILSSNGRYNYEPSAAKEQELASWLQQIEGSLALPN